MNSNRVTPCSTCGACCRSYIVPVCGYDVWLISTRQHLAPNQFVIAMEQEVPGSDGFRLNAAGPTLGLMLDKQGRLAVKRACVFLMDLNGGHARCGIYDHRPVVCRAYPMLWKHGHISQRSDALCPPDAWPDVEVRRPVWHEAVQRVEMQFDVYGEVVARWNARVAAASQRYFDVDEFFSYLLNVYAQIAELDAALGKATLDQVARSWRTGPRPGDDLVTPRAHEAEFPWVDYLSRIRGIVNAFYPSVATPCEPDRKEGHKHGTLSEATTNPGRRG